MSNFERIVVVIKALFEISNCLLGEEFDSATATMKWTQGKYCDHRMFTRQYVTVEFCGSSIPDVDSLQILLLAVA